MALSSLDPFVWGAGGAQMTPDQIARQREIASALIGQGVDTSPVGDWTQGAARVLEALSGGLKNRRADQAEAANASTNQQLISDALMGSGPQQFPAAPSGSTSPASYQANGNDVRDGIISTANALGIDPVDLGTAISYETGGTFDPTKAGPTTQWGQHKGLIQFGEPQAKQFGVDWSNPVASQLGPDGAVAKYLQSTGVKPGMGLLDIYSAINAGGVGRYGASDANNGGAPGTVRDKVEQQMAAHRAKALALLGASDQPPAVAAVNTLAQPQQVASLDPSVGMVAPEANSPFTPDAGQPIASDPKTQRILGQMMNPQPMGGTPMQTAQAGGADLSQIPVTAGGNAGVYQPGQGGNMQAIVRALSNPAASEQTRKIAGMLLGQQMDQQAQANDPMRALQLQKAQLELDALRNPKAQPLINAGGGAIYNPNDGQWLTAPNGGQTEQPSRVREYEYAKGQGFPGSFNDWLASQKGSMSLSVDPATGQVSFQQGGNIKPMTEAQSKDTTFAVRAEGALPILDKFGNALTSLPESAAGALPGGVGNYMQSPEYQQAQQAGTEFLQAILRKDTGAAITPQETAEYGKVYLPRPGDSPAVLAQKQTSRTRALEALKAGMTPQAILAQEKALEKTGETASGVPQPGTVMDGFRFKGGDPADQNNWEPAQ